MFALFLFSALVAADSLVWTSQGESEPHLFPKAYQETSEPETIREDFLDLLRYCETRQTNRRIENMQLSKNFTLEEFTRSETASAHGLSNNPNDSQISLIKLFTIEVLQPLRDKLGPLNITSGFRSPELNDRVGGAKNSAHMVEGGFIAVDIQLNQDGSEEALMKIIKMVDKLELPVSQVILEPSWVHISSHNILLRGPTYLKAARQASGRYTYSCLEF